MKKPGDLVRVWRPTHLWLTTIIDDARYVTELKRNDLVLILERPHYTDDYTMVLCLFGNRLGYVFLEYVNNDAWVET